MTVKCAIEKYRQANIAWYQNQHNATKYRSMRYWKTRSENLVKEKNVSEDWDDWYLALYATTYLKASV